MAELLAQLGSGFRGLSTAQARDALARAGPNTIARDSPLSWVQILLRQFRSPLVLVLLLAAIVAAAAADATQAVLIVLIVLASTAIGFAQEFRATRAVAALRARLRTTSRVWRDGALTPVPTPDIVPGDVVELAAGALIPADGVLLAARDCFVVQSVLTGESLPVEKLTTPTAVDASLPARTNVLFMGTSVRSGTATMLVVKTAAHTSYGQIAGRLRLRRPQTEFEHGIARFSAMLTELVLVLTVLVMGINVLLDRPVLESLLFAVALAVGITPELLPAIVTFTLSRGARELAAQGVLVRHLPAIENLGSISVLCADKTGTLTAGAAKLAHAIDTEGTDSPRVLELAALNARLQTGLANPLDEVIVAATAHLSLAASKVDESPYDFVRKRMSVCVTDGGTGGHLTIAKGAAGSILEVCTQIRTPAGIAALTKAHRREVLAQVARYAEDGLRVLAVASRGGTEALALEAEMVFEGLLLFEDPVKPDVQRILKELHTLGVRLKIITGDNQHTARHVATAVGMKAPRMLSGAQLLHMGDEALCQQAESTDVFAEVDPNQKERIILALRKAGEVVGYIGDGINDAPALHAADVGISVDSAVDVAKEAADVVLLEHDLRVVNRGIRQGRITFANTQKYILSTTSANFGNMLSMAAASAFLPFLPLLAPQILLNNLLSDIPAMTLAGDRVEAGSVRKPSHWRMKRIRSFTLVFGAVSSLFDLLTFAVLLRLGHSAADVFRSGWFLESLATEVLVLFVIRSPRRVISSRPSSLMLASSAAVLLAALLLVQTSLGHWLGFTPLPVSILLPLLGITVAYAGAVEVLKRSLYAMTEPTIELKKGDDHAIRQRYQSRRGS